MMRKLVVMLMAVLFSLSVSGLGFAAEEKSTGATGAAQPCAGKEMPKKKGAKRRAAKKKAAKKEEGAAPATPATPATPPSK